MVREIPLNSGTYPGKAALVSDEDHDWIAAYQWGVQPDKTKANFYAARWDYRDGRRVRVWMHREIPGAPADVRRDHIDGNGLNNQRGNLRPATAKQNNRNARIPRNNTTGFKGTSVRRNGFSAGIGVDGEYFDFGWFARLEDAARIYDAAARRFFGEFARTNFSGPDDEADLMLEIILRQMALRGRPVPSDESSTEAAA